MSVGRAEVWIDVPPSEVWEWIKAFDGIDRWMPGIDSLSIDGDDRTIEMLGMKIKEHLVQINDTQMSTTYSIVDGVPVDSHKATISVEGSGKGSKVVWEVSVSPDEMLPVFESTYQVALEHLAKLFSEPA
ncbi:MAG: SRPBCC family protein [Actinobacteria bacterium]|nr:SRPBCC family protein [Actinomycetota bacterium]